jgi:hypothetical protein
VGHLETNALAAVMVTKSAATSKIAKCKEGLQFNSSASAKRPHATAETGPLIMAARAPRHRPQHRLGGIVSKTLSKSNDTL